MSGSGGLPIVSKFETPALAAGQFWCLRVDTTGALVTTLAGGSATVVGNRTPSDDYANPTTAVETLALLAGYDGATYDRLRSGQVGTITAANLAIGYLNTLPMARYASGAIVLADGEARMLQSTQGGFLRSAEQLAPQAEDNTNGVLAVMHKPLATNTYAWTVGTDMAADPDKSWKASAGNVFGFMVRNLNAATRYFQLHSKASAPGAADIPYLPSFIVPSGAQLLIGAEFFGPNGIYFSTGIASGFSTTEANYTAGAAGDQYTAVFYK